MKNAIANCVTAGVFILLVTDLPRVQAQEQQSWIGPMRKVHDRFTGEPGTFACFGDSITVSLGFWAPLEGEPKNMPSEMAAAHALVKKHMKPECWRQRGPGYGNEGRMIFAGPVTTLISG